jgi:HD-like signal output (HDOD) protein
MNIRKILLVGCSPRSVARLKSAFARKYWQVSSASSFDDALAVLIATPTSALICDLQSTKAADFLARARNALPGVARLAYAERSTLPDDIIPILHVAQQVLREGQSDDELCESVARACALQQLFVNPALSRIVGQLDRLPSVPSTYWALMREAEREHCNASELAAIVESDPAMSVKVLQLVNSAFFGLAQRVTSIQQAVGYLGTNLLRGLVLTAHIFSEFSGGANGSGISATQFQAYSLRVARLAKRFLPSGAEGDLAYTAGLLIDIGRLIIGVRMPVEFEEIAAHVIESGTDATTAEFEQIGVTHCDVGAYLLGLWGLPLTIVEVVAFHHNPGMVEGQFNCRVLAAVHAADALLGIACCGEPVERLDLAFLEREGMSAELPRWRTLAAAEAAQC